MGGGTVEAVVRYERFKSHEISKTCCGMVNGMTNDLLMENGIWMSSDWKFDNTVSVFGKIRVLGMTDVKTMGKQEW